MPEAFVEFVGGLKLRSFEDLWDFKRILWKHHIESVKRFQVRNRPGKESELKKWSAKCRRP